MVRIDPCFRGLFIAWKKCEVVIDDWDWLYAVDILFGRVSPLLHGSLQSNAHLGLDWTGLEVLGEWLHSCLWCRKNCILR